MMLEFDDNNNLVKWNGNNPIYEFINQYNQSLKALEDMYRILLNSNRKESDET